MSSFVAEVGRQYDLLLASARQVRGKFNFFLASLGDCGRVISD